METEVWPDMVAACAQVRHSAGAGQRPPEREVAGQGRAAGRLSRPAYRHWRRCGRRPRTIPSAWCTLGAKVKGVFGNLKFDASPDAAQLEHGRRLRVRSRRVRGGVRQFARRRGGRLLEVLKRHGELAPVPPEQEAFDRPRAASGAVDDRAAASAALRRGRGACRAAGLRRSRAAAADGAAAGRRVWLGDSLGEMALYYGLADVALLGGSFEPLGGQNLIEAAACGCPVVMGPSHLQFRRSGGVRAGGGGGGAGAEHGRGRAPRSRPGRQRDAASGCRASRHRVLRRAQGRRTEDSRGGAGVARALSGEGYFASSVFSLDRCSGDSVPLACRSFSWPSSTL